MKDLQDYTIAMVASHGMMNFVTLHVNALKSNKIRYNRLVIGDVGLTPGDKQWIRSQVPSVQLVDCEHKFFETVEVQSPDYRVLIAQRPQFLLGIGDSKILSVDADTAILGNDFEDVDFRCDMTLNVRDVQPKDHVMNISARDYPNLGVVFYHNFERCREFVMLWDKITRTELPLKQFEQGNFYRAMQKLEFSQLNVQRVHCRKYNCYDPRWMSPKTQIIHYKSYSMMRMNETGSMK